MLVLTLDGTWMSEDEKDCVLEADVLFSTCEFNATTWVLVLVGALAIPT